MTTALGVGLALPCIGTVSGGGGPVTTFPNGFRYQLQRIIPAELHLMPEGGSGWFQYRRTATALRSVANGGKVVNGTFLDHRFEGGNTVAQHELEAWNASTGFILAWLFLSGFRAGLDYSVFHYYGNATLTLTQTNPIATWAGFTQSNNLATGIDLTGNSRNLTLTGVSASTIFSAEAGDFA